MPHHKSCKKRLKKSALEQVRNNATKTVLRRTVRKTRQSIDDGQEINLNEIFANIDKAWNKGILHKNKAARLKSRMAKAAARKTSAA